MTCFEWQTRSSDFLDAQLPEAERTEAQSHLDSCPRCSESHKHFRLLLAAIASQPHFSLPQAIRKAPYSALVPRAAAARMTGRFRWENLPWYLRTTVEGGLIVLTILLGISMGPKIRGLYERNIERSLSEYMEGANESAEGKGAAPAPLSGDQLAQLNSSHNDFGGDEGEDSGEDEEEASAGAGNEKVRVGKSEIWRFNLRTDSPQDLHTDVVNALVELGLKPTHEGLKGVVYPGGGIQLDLVVPQSIVSSLKGRLQKLAPRTPEGLSGSPSGDTFTWYKNKSRRKIPEGQTRVVIWLAQF